MGESLFKPLEGGLSWAEVSFAVFGPMGREDLRPAPRRLVSFLSGDLIFGTLKRYLIQNLSLICF